MAHMVSLLPGVWQGRHSNLLSALMTAKEHPLGRFWAHEGGEVHHSPHDIQR